MQYRRDILLEKGEHMGQNEFWNIVDDIQWSVDADIDYLQEWLVKQYPGQSKKLRKMSNVVRKRLCETLCDYSEATTGNKYSGIYRVGDDGFWDLTAHIVGLGKEYYKSVISNPEIAVVMGNNLDYKENFQYIFSNSDNS